MVFLIEYSNHWPKSFLFYTLNCILLFLFLFHIVDYEWCCVQRRILFNGESSNLTDFSHLIIRVLISNWFITVISLLVSVVFPILSVILISTFNVFLILIPIIHFIFLVILPVIFMLILFPPNSLILLPILLIVLFLPHEPHSNYIYGL